MDGEKQAADFKISCNNRFQQLLKTQSKQFTVHQINHYIDM